MMNSQAVQCLVGMQSELYAKGIEFNMLFAHGLGTPIARQKLFEAAVKCDADYILSLDSDHTYKVEDVLNLIRDLEDNDLDMLSAKYYVRNSFVDRKIAMLRWKDDDLEQIPAQDESGIKECDVVGFGFLVLKPDMVKDLLDRFGKIFKFHNENVWGEDLYFCIKAKEAGYKVCYDADVIVGHISTIVNK